MTVTATRIATHPIIHQGMCPSLGDNINGPSLVRRPDWAPGRSRYMLYFGHHKGQHIRLAMADQVTGPWTIHSPGVLPLAATPLAQSRPDTAQPEWARAAGQDGLYPHLSSPDVLVNAGSQQFEMWFHGLAECGEQVTYRALSGDGMEWQVTGPPTDDTYLRVFQVRGQIYAMARLGRLMRLEPDGVFAPGPLPFARQIRHVAVLLRGDALHVVYSCIGDTPERLLHTALDVSRPYPDWPVAVPETEFLRPQHGWEGADLPVSTGLPGATGFTHALRDPALFVDNGQVWMIYVGGGEAAMGFARIDGL